MRFRIEMECDNAAFDDDPTPEVGRILTSLAAKIEGVEWDDLIMLRDINGNTVGKAWFEGGE